jgi:alpha-amylase
MAVLPRLINPNNNVFGFKKTNSIIVSTLLFSSVITSSVQAETILHAFNWQYSAITEQASQIAQAGYKKVLISPPLKSTGNEWWARYQPQDIRLIDSPLGNKEDLQAMISALALKGVDVYADVVLNHMANESWKRSDLNYPGSELLNQYNQNMEYVNNQKLFGDLTQGLFSEGDFHPAGCITNWGDPGHVQYWRLCGGDGDVGLPDLDPNDWVVSQQRLYLQALKDMGVKGFRIDAVKHMSEYQINQVFTPEIISNMHVFGEVITSGGAGTGDYHSFLEPYLNSTSHSAYDFPLFASIRAAFSFNGSMTLLHDPLAYGQALPNERAVTFTITHDIPTNDGFRYQILDPTDEQLAYAYILGKDGGTPLIYSDALLPEEDKDNGRWKNVWSRSDMVNMIRFHNSMQGKSMQVMYSDQCMLIFKRDKQGFVAINKCGEDRTYTIDTDSYEFNWYIPYRDNLSDESVTFDSRYYNLTVPGRTARMFVQNTSPQAIAGSDLTIEATGNPDTELLLNGSSSSDLDNDTLSFIWTGGFGSVTGESPIVQLPIGIHEIFLEVSDGATVSTDSIKVTVEDTTAPLITVPEDVTVYASNGDELVDIGIATADDLFAPVVVSSDAPDKFPLGTTTVTWSATDLNGNTATDIQNVTVYYDFKGFNQPIDNLPVVNTVKAGKVIPIKWQIASGDGTYIRDLSAVSSLQTNTVGCESDKNSIEDPIEAETSGKAGLHYDLITDQFVFNWKTSKDMKGSCMIFALNLKDGNSYNAKFKLW